MANYVYVWSKGVTFEVVLRSVKDFSWFWAFTTTFGGKCLVPSPRLTEAGIVVRVDFREDGNENPPALYARALHHAKIKFSLSPFEGTETYLRSTTSNVRWYQVDIDLLEGDPVRVSFDEAFAGGAPIRFVQR